MIVLSKMKTNLDAFNLYTPSSSQIEYMIETSDAPIKLNSLLDHEIKIEFTGSITCVECGKRLKKTYAEGLCYPCMRDSARASECIIRPELCQGHLGYGRDPDWEERNHNQEHVVYLASTSKVKVGVTRSTQVPTRWIDQGARQAIVLARTPYRQLAGLIEVALKNHMGDRTNWRHMLQDVPYEGESLDVCRRKALTLLEDYFDPDTNQPLSVYGVDDEPVHTLNYPVQTYPEKVKSVGLDKNAVIEGRLLGIRGQYLLLDQNRVVQVRKHTGYHIQFSVK